LKLSQFSLRSGLTDVFAGTICSVLSIAYCLSYAALIFTGPLDRYLSYGISVSFLSALIAGAIVALRSSLTFAVAGPDSSISVVIAAMVATVMQRLVASGSADALGPALIAMSLATAMTGLLLCVLGFTNAARAIRFLPYPVIGGFLGATGWLMVTGAMQVVSDRKPTLFNLGTFADAGVLEKLAAGAVVAIALHVLLRRSKSPFVLPGVLLAAFRGCAYRGFRKRLDTGRRTNQRMDVQSSTGRQADPPVEPNGYPHIPLGRFALYCRRCTRRHVRDHQYLAAQYHRD
jgi:SulP family sulfate permease